MIYIKTYPLLINISMLDEGYLIHLHTVLII